MDELLKNLADEITALYREIGVEVNHVDRRALQATTTPVDMSAHAVDDSLARTKLDGVIEHEDNLSTL